MTGHRGSADSWKLRVTSPGMVCQHGLRWVPRSRDTGESVEVDGPGRAEDATHDAEEETAYERNGRNSSCPVRAVRLDADCSEDCRYDC